MQQRDFVFDRQETFFAVLAYACAGWHGIKINPAIGQTLDGLRKNSSAKPSSQLAT
jgi:hypothetical protein